MMAATDKHATIEELLEAVFSVRSYNEDQLPLQESRERVCRQSGESCGCSCGRGQFRNPEEGEHSSLESATKHGSEDSD
jgi:hypothetical protein